MSRLTQRDGDSYTYSEYATSRDGSCCFGVARLRNEAIDKLGMIEDIEDEIGCPIETVFKALKDGVYMKTKHFGVVYYGTPKAVKYKSGWKLLVHGAVLGLQTYGKTWALAKEELQ